MSIDQYELAKAVLVDKSLYALEPEAEGVRQERVLLLSKAMRTAIIDGPWSNEAEEDRLAGTLRADLERFVAGDLLRASLGGRNLAAEDMKRLADTYEVWEFKSDTNPKQGIRVFGRFAGFDLFVATHWQWRDALDDYGSQAWNNEINRCKDDWFDLFKKQTPHTGDNIDAYLSNAEDATLFY